MILLVDLDNGNEIHADEGQLREHGIPDGYVSLDSLSKEQLWEQLRKFLEEHSDADDKLIGAVKKAVLQRTGKVG